MKIIHQVSNQFTLKDPIAVTLGFFDGLHLGHQKLFQKLKELKGQQGMSVAITFKNHPLQFIKPDTPFPLICTLDHRIRLIQEQGIDTLVLLDFNQQLRETTADDFLMNLVDHIPFSHFVLGPDASLGRNKEGNTELIQLLSKKYAFDFHMLSSVRSQREIISSTLIRKNIELGRMDRVKELLGRPYSIYSKVIPGAQLGQALGFSTLNFEVEGLILPPLGVYKVHLQSKKGPLLGIANLGYAPTLQDRKDAVLEVHLLDFNEKVIEPRAEIIFLDYIRAEKKFSSMDELKAQIHKDIAFIQQN